MNNEEKIKQAAEILSKAKNIVGFTGAGTSAESGIPPFRGEGGIWNQYDPNSLDIDFYYATPRSRGRSSAKCSITSSATRTST
jgi:NAD-dependent protein deacetylases, SIR2 family